MSPLCSTRVEPDGVEAMEPFYSLHARVCRNCFRAELRAFVRSGDSFSHHAADGCAEAFHARRLVLGARGRRNDH